MITRIFKIVANSLLWIASRMNLTYHEINIIVYYFIVPLTWCIMLDVIIKKAILTPIWILFWIVIFIRVRKHFSKWCDRVFKKSVDFLLWFQWIGWDYYKASVIICCVVPVLIYIALGFLLWM